MSITADLKMSAVNPYHCHHLQHAPAIPTTAVVLLTSLFQPYVNGVIVSRVLEFETSKIRLRFVGIWLTCSKDVINKKLPSKCSNGHRLPPEPARADAHYRSARCYVPASLLLPKLCLSVPVAI